MLAQLLLALILTTATVAVHGIGTVYVVIPMARVWDLAAADRESRRPVKLLVQLVTFLLGLHLAEVALWAGGYALIGVLPDFETSLYFSLKSYSTVGYGDVLPATSWRLLGPIEALVGVLMLGWSTSILVAALQQIYNHRRSAS